MPRPKPAPAPKSPKPPRPSAFEKALEDMHHQPKGAFAPVSPRWLLSAFAIAIAGSLVLAWLTLCLLYWQGAWQLLYHPTTAVARTPAAASLAFEPIHFAAADNGTPQLAAWWIPAPNPRFTILLLHTAEGNLGDTVDDIAALHRAGSAVFAIDYLGYGDSVQLSGSSRPSERKLLHDAESALDYLTATRHLNPARIVVFGNGLGADIAAELATRHSSLAGVILDAPPVNPTHAIFGDPRSRLVPAHLLVSDRYDLAQAARQLTQPSLWLFPQDLPANPAAQFTSAPRTQVWLPTPFPSHPQFTAAISRWLDDLPSQTSGNSLP